MQEEEIIKEKLLLIYTQYRNKESAVRFKNNCPPKLQDLAFDVLRNILDLKKSGKTVDQDYKNAAMNLVHILTLPELSKEHTENYERAMRNIAKENPEPAKLEEAQNPPPKKRGCTTKKIKYTILRQHAIRHIRDHPEKNPFKQEYKQYFSERLQEQETTMRRPLNERKRKTQEQKDAYFASQIETIKSRACSTRTWEGLEKECQLTAEELIMEPDYDITKLMLYYGSEMLILGITKKEKMPKHFPEKLIEKIEKLLQTQT